MVNNLKNTMVLLQNTKKVPIRMSKVRKFFFLPKDHLQDTLTEMEQDLQSSISYAGGRKVADLRHVDYVIVKNSIWNGDAH